MNARVGDRVVMEERQLQKRCFEKIVKNKDYNSILVLPTNSGKTFVATKLIHKYLINPEFFDRIVIFTASTVVLCQQQLRNITYDLEHTLGGLRYSEEGPWIGNLISRIFAGGHGAQDCELHCDWKQPETWELYRLNRSEFKKRALEALSGRLSLEEQQRLNADGSVSLHFGMSDLDLSWPRLLVMTPARCVDLLAHGLLRLDDVSLLVMDECHHAAGNASEALLMRAYYQRHLKAKSYVPKFLGLTASPVNTGTKKTVGEKARADLNSLCDLCHAKIVTDSDLSEAVKVAESEATCFSEELNLVVWWWKLIDSRILEPLRISTLPPCNKIFESQDDLFNNMTSMQPTIDNLPAAYRPFFTQCPSPDLGNNNTRLRSPEMFLGFKNVESMANRMRQVLTQILSGHNSAASLPSAQQIVEAIKKEGKRKQTDDAWAVDSARQWLGEKERIAHILFNLGFLGFHLRMECWFESAVSVLSSGMQKSGVTSSSTLEQIENINDIIVSTRLFQTKREEIIEAGRRIQHAATLTQPHRTRFAAYMASHRASIDPVQVAQSNTKQIIDPIDQIITRLALSGTTLLAFVQEILKCLSGQANSDNRAWLESLLHLLPRIAKASRRHAKAAQRLYAVHLYEDLILGNAQLREAVMLSWRLKPVALTWGRSYTKDEIGRLLNHTDSYKIMVSQKVLETEIILLQALAENRRPMKRLAEGALVAAESLDVIDAEVSDDVEPDDVSVAREFLPEEFLRSDSELYLSATSSVKLLVFCQKKSTCHLLSRLLERRGFCRAAAVTSSLTTSSGGVHWLAEEGASRPLEAEAEGMSERVQAERVAMFRELDILKPATLQMLVATSVVEEGFDLAACQAVVRFDAPPTLTQHLQSRGRARREGSTYHLLVDCTSLLTQAEENQTSNLLQQEQAMIDLVRNCQDRTPEPFPDSTDLLDTNVLASKISGAYLNARMATKTVNAVIQQMVIQRDENGNFAEPELREWMIRTGKCETDWLIKYKGEEIAVPPLRGGSGNPSPEAFVLGLGHEELTITGANTKQHAQIKKNVIPELLMLSLLRRLYQSKVLNEFFLPFTKTPRWQETPPTADESMGVDEDGVQWIYRKVPQCLAGLPSGTIDAPQQLFLHRLVFTIDRWNSDVLAFGGLHGQWKRFYNASGKAPNSSTETPVPIDDEDDSDEKLIKKDYKRKTVTDLLEAEANEAVSTLLYRSKVLDDRETAQNLFLGGHVNVDPFGVVQPLALLLTAPLEDPVEMILSNCATKEPMICRVECVDASTAVAFSADESLCLQAFMRVLLNFWRVGSFNGPETDDSSRPPIFFLALLNEDAASLDWLSMKTIIHSDLFLQLGNPKVKEIDHQNLTLKALMELSPETETWMDDEVDTDVADLANSIRRDGDMMRDGDMRQYINRQDSLFLGDSKETLRRLRRHLHRRGEETWLLRSDHRGSAYHFYRSDGGGDDDEWLVAKCWQGARLGSSRAEMLKRTERSVCSRNLFVSLVSAPVVFCLSLLPAIIWKVEVSCRQLEVRKQILAACPSISGLRRDLTSLALTSTAAVGKEDAALARLHEDRQCLRLREGTWKCLQIHTRTLELLDIQTATSLDAQVAAFFQRMSKLKQAAAKFEKCNRETTSGDNSLSPRIGTSLSSSEGTTCLSPRKGNIVLASDLMMPDLPTQQLHSQTLEFVGDAILKYVTAVWAFLSRPEAEEGELSKLTSVYKSNAWLASVCERENFETAVLTRAFSVRHHAVKCVAGRLADLRHQPVSSKQKADLIEALIAAIYWSNFDGPAATLVQPDGPIGSAQGIAAASNFIEHFILPASSNVSLTDLVQVIMTPPPPTKHITAHRQEEITRLWLHRANSDPFFSNKLFACRIPKSHRMANFESYERLEFLGDSCLGFLLTEWLHRLFPDVREGPLSLFRSPLQSNRYLCWSLMRRFTKAKLPISSLLIDESPQNCLSADNLQEKLTKTPSDEDLYECIQYQHTNHSNQEPLIKRIADVYEAMLGATLILLKLDVREVWRVIEEDFTRSSQALKRLINDEEFSLKIQLSCTREPQSSPRRKRGHASCF